MKQNPKMKPLINSIIINDHILNVLIMFLILNIDTINITITIHIINTAIKYIYL